MTEVTPSIAERAAEALHDSARTAIPLGIALIGGVFVSLGIQGDLLPRLLRNAPVPVGLALTGAVLGVTAPLVLSGLKPEKLKWVTIVSALLLVVSTCAAIFTGILVTGTREQPNVDVTGIAIDATNHSATLEVAATSLSLASDDRMLLRIAVFDHSTSLGRATSACADTRDVDIAEPPSAEVVYWGETGPTATGTADTTYTFTVDTAKFRYACAIAVLSRGGAPRASTVTVDLVSFAVSN